MSVEIGKLTERIFIFNPAGRGLVNCPLSGWMPALSRRCSRLALVPVS